MLSSQSLTLMTLSTCQAVLSSSRCSVAGAASPPAHRDCLLGATGLFALAHAPSLTHITFKKCEFEAAALGMFVIEAMAARRAGGAAAEGSAPRPLQVDVVIDSFE